MAVYDKNFTDELRTRLSIVDVVGRRVPLTKKGQNFWGCCPFHNEKTPSFSVNEDRGFYHCFGCGAHGDIISFTMQSQNIDFRAAIAELAEMAGVKLPEYKPKSPQQVAAEESYFDIMDTAAGMYEKYLFEPAGAAALAYVRRRGFDDATIKKYRIGYAPKNNVVANKFANTKQSDLIATGMCRRGEYGMYDFFRDRLMFPIFNARGKIVAFSGRSLDGSEPKYINTADTEMFHKRKTVFGFNFARDAIHRANRTIVVEGQIDAIKMQTNGFGETVAPLGTALTEDHIAILCKANRNITFCFDGDNAGQKAAARACSIVMPFLRDASDVRFAFVTGGKDPDEVLSGADGEKKMHEIINNAMPLTDFLWNIANKNFVVATPGGRVAAEKFINNEIDKIQDKSLRAEYAHEFNERKFNAWHKWKKTKSNAPKIDIPNAGDIRTRTLQYIINNFPEIIERHGEFLATLNIPDNDAPGDFGLTADAAEKFIISVKLQNYMATLKARRQETVSKMFVGAATGDDLNAIDADIKKCAAKLDTLLTLND